MNTVERVKAECKEQKIPISRLEKDLGFANGYIGQLKKGTLPDNRLTAIADYLKVQARYLTGESEYRTMKEELEEYDKTVDYNKLNKELEIARNPARPISRIGDKGIKIPVLGSVAAGIPIEMITDIVDWEEIPQAMSKSGEYFGLKIKGDSMSPRIAEGDTVIVRKQDDAESGDIVIASINGYEATCKRLMKYQDKISLISFNPLYKPMDFTNAEVLSKPVRILGKVVENRQKY